MSGARRRAGAAVLVLAALALGRLVSDALPGGDGLEQPFVRSGSVGAQVALRYARVTAGTPTGSTVADDGAALLATPGVWVAVPLTVLAEDEPRRLAYAALVGSDGRTYEADGVRSRLTIGSATPGIAHHGQVLVELPADAAAGAHLRIALHPWDQRADDVADIDLEITPADVTRWLAASEPVVVTPATDLPVEP